MEEKHLITINDFNRLVKDGKVTAIDVRSLEEFKEKHIPFALNIPIKEIESGEAKIDGEKTIVTVCGSGGGRSTRAANLIREKYSTDAFFLEDGTFGWLENESRNKVEKLSFFQKIVRRGYLPGDTEDEKIKKATLFIMAFPFALAGLL
jgi:rhodanese-related sulfurtransferase